MVNLASRPCDESESGETLTSESVRGEADDIVEVSPGGEPVLKRFPNPVPVLKLTGIKR